VRNNTSHVYDFVGKNSRSRVGYSVWRGHFRLAVQLKNELVIRPIPFDAQGGNSIGLHVAEHAVVERRLIATELIVTASVETSYCESASDICRRS